MKEFVVTEQDEGVRLSRYLEKCVPLLTQSLMHRSLRLKRIKLNGKRCEASDRLCAGDVLQLYLNDELFAKAKKPPVFMKASRDIVVLYEDDNIAALYKPVGVLVHADKKEYDDTMVNRFLRYLYEKGQYDPASSGAFTPALVNRLDRGTDGIVLASKNAAALACLAGIVRERRLEKSYLCVTVSPPPRDGEYHAHLTKNEAKNIVSVTKKPRDGSKAITTVFRTLQSKDGLYLCEATLITGRTHQIRAHLRFLGAPILGDQKYGVADKNKRYGEKNQLLCAAKVRFVLDPEKDAMLWYLNDRTIEAPAVPFVKKYFDKI